MLSWPRRSPALAVARRCPPQTTMVLVGRPRHGDNLSGRDLVEAVPARRGATSTMMADRSSVNGVSVDHSLQTLIHHALLFCSTHGPAQPLLLITPEASNHASLDRNSDRNWGATRRHLVVSGDTLTKDFLANRHESARHPVMSSVFKTADGALCVPWAVGSRRLGDRSLTATERRSTRRRRAAHGSSRRTGHTHSKPLRCRSSVRSRRRGRLPSDPTMSNERSR